MNGMHGIIFSYEKRNDLRELGEIRSASAIIRACWTTWAPARTGTCPASGAA